MTVDLPAPLVSSPGGVPQVCSRHGEPAARQKPVVFRSYTPKWAYLLILFGVLPFAIVAAILQKRVKVTAWPFCQDCGRLRTRRLLTGLGLVALAIVGVVILAVVLPQNESYVGPIVLMFVLLLLAGMGIASSAASGPLAAGYVSNDGATVHVRKAHPRFAEQAAAIQAAAAQQWAAQQQQWAAQQQYPHQGYAGTQQPSAYSQQQQPYGRP